VDRVDRPAGGILRLKLYDAQGRLVLSQRSGGGEGRFSV
jgi:hypothetical protein